MTIHVQQLTYTYNRRVEPALIDVTVVFRPGEVTLIAGASGCGKTTLVRCINGLIPQSYTNGHLLGKVELFGRDNAAMSIANISQIVGTVLQDPERQMVASNVIDEIAFGLENLGLPRDEIMQRVHETASLLRIDHLLRRETFHLSGGEKQKIVLAGVLAMRPQVIMLDEPLASLDSTSGLEALILMRQLAERGIAIVIIEHRVEDVLSIHPEHCVYMTQGRISYDGDARGLLQAVDWREIKLPAPVIIERIRAENHNMSSLATIQSQNRRQNPDERNSQHDRLPSEIPMPSQELDDSSTLPLLQYRHVHFQYADAAEVLNDITFDVHRGDRIAVLGPNGAGKTTLVKHAIGLLRPTRGEVLIEGVDSRSFSVAQIARRVGFVFQSPSHMLFAPTVHEELSFGPRNIGMQAQTIETQVERALHVVNLASYRDMPPLALSFGQQKRISIASVLTMSPRLLVMDEPTAGQDYANYTRLLDDILAHTKLPTRRHLMDYDALIFITHDLDIAISYANRVLLLADGRLVADGTPESVLSDQASLSRCRVQTTSLLEANLSVLAHTHRFKNAIELASVV